MNSNTYTKLLSISSAIIAVTLVSQLFIHSSSPDLPNKEDSKSGNYYISAINIPEKMTFAGEAVPIERYDVKESLDRELLVNTYWQSQTLLFIKRAHRYFPIMEPILKEYGIPDDLKYLAVIESGLVPAAKSPAGAVGLWQFMKATGREYGLQVNSEVDERYHTEKATIAACKYLKKMNDHYKSWALSAAAYNAGRTGVNRQLSRQKADSYYDLVLGEETGRYVYRIIALKEILNDPEKYGFHVDEQDLYQQVDYTTVEIKKGIPNIADYAHEYNTTYKQLKNLNPWLRENVLTNSSKNTYEIKLPLASKAIIEKTKNPSKDSIANDSIAVKKPA